MIHERGDLDEQHLSRQHLHRHDGVVVRSVGQLDRGLFLRSRREVLHLHLGTGPIGDQPVDPGLRHRVGKFGATNGHDAVARTQTGFLRCSAREDDRDHPAAVAMVQREARRNQTEVEAVTGVQKVVARAKLKPAIVDLRQQFLDAAIAFFRGSDLAFVGFQRPGSLHVHVPTSDQFVNESVLTGESFGIFDTLCRKEARRFERRSGCGRRHLRQRGGRMADAQYRAQHDACEHKDLSKECFCD